MPTLLNYKCENLRLNSLLTSLDISFDSRESLYFGITLPENGVLFENLENLTPYFIGALRGFAGICRFPYSSPDKQKPHPRLTLRGEV